MDILNAHKRVLEWVKTADSYDKIGFLKEFVQGFGLEEVHVAKNLLANVRQMPENRKRPWNGPSVAEKKRRLVQNQRIPSTNEQPLQLPTVPSLPRSLVPRCEKNWWESLGREPVGYDAEHVHLSGPEYINAGIGKVKAGIVGVVDSSYNRLYNRKVQHEPYTFAVDRYTLRSNGIGTHSLVNGTDMKVVTAKLKELFDDKLVIVLDGSTDFACVNLKMANFVHFDLQQFYRRNAREGMSLRDIYFFEFNRDFQGNKVHDAEEDAKATLKIFIEGYCVRLKDRPESKDPNYYEIFDTAVRLKKRMKKGVFCNSEKKFKDWKLEKCICSEC